jgi:hypothetical protein
LSHKTDAIRVTENLGSTDLSDQFTSSSFDGLDIDTGSSEFGIK